MVRDLRHATYKNIACVGDVFAIAHHSGANHVDDRTFLEMRLAWPCEQLTPADVRNFDFHRIQLLERLAGASTESLNRFPAREVGNVRKIDRSAMPDASQQQHVWRQIGRRLRACRDT